MIVDTSLEDDAGRPTPRNAPMGFLTGSKLYDFTHPLVETFRAPIAARNTELTLEYLPSHWQAWATL
jgi:hypothetical protein